MVERLGARNLREVRCPTRAEYRAAARNERPPLAPFDGSALGDVDERDQLDGRARRDEDHQGEALAGSNTAPRNDAGDVVEIDETHPTPLYLAHFAARASTAERSRCLV